MLTRTNQEMVTIQKQLEAQIAEVSAMGKIKVHKNEQSTQDLILKLEELVVLNDDLMVAN